MNTFNQKTMKNIVNVTEFVNEDGTPATGQPTIQPTASPTGGTTAPYVPPPTRPTVTAAPPCQSSQTAVLGLTNICKGALIFSEEFEKNNVRELINWDPETKFPQEPVSSLKETISIIEW